MPVASAQVKSCLLLAGLYAHGLTVVLEPGPARDHTERMLAAMGAPIAGLRQQDHQRTADRRRSRHSTSPCRATSRRPPFCSWPGAIAPDSRITIAGVGINPTRTGIVEALAAMGATIAFDNRARRGRRAGGRPRVVTTSSLRGTTFGGEQIVTMIDELPVLAVAATQAEGRTVVRDADELRVKETDRIATTVSELRKLGAEIEPTDDGFIIDGPTPLIGAPVESHDDHRLAMAMTVAGLVAKARPRSTAPK